MYDKISFIACCMSSNGDGGAVLSNRENVVVREEFYSLNEEQTKELKSILE